MKKLVSLTYQELVARKRECEEKELCFISKRPHNHENIALVKHPVVGLVIVQNKFVVN